MPVPQPGVEIHAAEPPAVVDDLKPGNASVRASWTTTLRAAACFTTFVSSSRAQEAGVRMAA
ncbi:hypothetical protein ACIBG5_20290 [Kribbella sp. NPDC050241]|uniref:hypothetical protein n=1 Tax=Kribbella sp. NPDC050241 TaxID=3364115 RepID=UPI0037B7576D